MSGAKTGEVTSTDTPSSSLLAVVSAGALAVGALGGAAMALSLAGKGIFMLGKKTYDAIDHAIEDSVAKDLAKREASLRKVFENIDRNQDAEEVFQAEEKKMEIGNFDALIQKLTEMAEQREKIEKQKKLKPNVSQEFRNALERCKEEKAKTLTRSKKRKTAPIDKRFQQEINQIYTTLNELAPFFPVFAAQKKAAIKELDINKKSVARLICDVNEKSGLIKGDQARWYKILAVKYLALLKNPVYQQMTRQEKKQLDETYDRILELMNRCHTGEEAEKSILRFSSDAESLMESARQKETDRQYEQTIELLTQSMKNKGYDMISRKLGDLTVDFIFQKGKNQKVNISVKRTDADTEEVSEFYMEVTEGFASEEERNEEGRELVREMESCGLQMEYCDLTAPVVNEKNRGLVIENIRKELAKSSIHNISIKWETEATVCVGNHNFPVSASIRDMVRTYLETKESSSMQNQQAMTARQRQKI